MAADVNVDGAALDAWTYIFYLIGTGVGSGVAHPYPGAHGEDLGIGRDGHARRRFRACSCQPSGRVSTSNKVPYLSRSSGWLLVLVVCPGNKLRREQAEYH